MKQRTSWLLPVSLLLVAASVLAYGVHYLVFRDAYHIFFYLLLDIAFLFLNVLVVIIFIERLLAQRERQTVFQKLNMVIGTFFSEVGLELLKRFSARVANADALKERTDVQLNWKRKDYLKATAAAKGFSYDLNIDPPSLLELKTFLAQKRDFLVRLLENPSLLEHDRFTDLLWAVFHLAEELSFREGTLEGLPPADHNHLMGDSKRAYTHITMEWLAYLEHLKGSYPFLFSLAVRINPLGTNPSAYITDQ
jgi:hypothetical protein